MVHAVWKGSIAFGLVNIPIKLYSAVESQALGFRVLHKKCNTPLEYKRYCPKCKVEVPWSDVVKGLEIGKNKFHVFTKEDLKLLRPETTETIEIIEFVDRVDLDPIYFRKNYYIAPQQPKEKAYWLFKDVLAETAKVAIGRFVMREKQYVCAIESYKQGLLLPLLSQLAHP